MEKILFVLGVYVIFSLIAGVEIFFKTKKDEKKKKNQNKEKNHK